MLLCIHRLAIQRIETKGDIMKLTNAQAIAECRAEAAKNGMTFKRMKITINNSPAYEFISRASGETIISNCTLGSAYNIVCAGDLASHKQS